MLITAKDGTTLDLPVVKAHRFIGRGLATIAPQDKKRYEEYLADIGDEPQPKDGQHDPSRPRTGKTVQAEAKAALRRAGVSRQQLEEMIGAAVEKGIAKVIAGTKSKSKD